MNSNQYTFWELISEYSIEIPIIQRDYAQGREIEKIEEIRNTFLENLYESLENEKQLDLDFIYGSLKDGNVFIPLDGQQRLTTLFLLHWYLAAKEGRLESFNQILKEFKYETRVSSREFCENLCFEKEINFDSPLISEELINTSWFFLSWKKDLTIRAMLVMLNAIHKKFKNSNKLFDRLISLEKKLIFFRYIKMENFGLEDSLYIKMNARGKTLTPFENFKAKFIQLLQLKEDKMELKEGFTKGFSEKIDKDWLDLFWKYKDEDGIFDKKMMNFINIILINQYASNSKLQLKDLKDSLDKDEISFMKYLELDFLTKEAIEEIVNTLEFLKNGNDEIKTYLPDSTIINERTFFRKIIENSNSSLKYIERVMFFAITQYFIINKNIDQKEFSNWIRVIRNLAENTIDNDPEEFSRSLKAVKLLLPYSKNILNYLIDSNNKVNRFYGNQIIEERVKAVLILKDKKWEEVITKAENDGYLKGRIGFILDFCGVMDFYKKDKKLNWTSEEDLNCYNKFNNYLKKYESCFNENGVKLELEELWRRSLLCFGDYLLLKGLNYSFLINGQDRDISWKRLLREKEKRIYIKELFDNIDINNIEKSLKSIINESKIDDWRKYFIEIPELINECGKDKYIRITNNDDILLLNSSRTSGRCKEYYTYALYRNLKDDNTDIDYYDTVGANSWKWIELSRNGFSIAITYEKNEIDEWVYVIEGNEEKKIEFSNQEEVKEYLKKYNYIN